MFIWHVIVPRVSNQTLITDKIATRVYATVKKLHNPAAAMPFQRNDSKLLRELPWLTNVVMGGDALLHEDFKAFSRKVEEVEQELNGNSIAVQWARKVMLIGVDNLEEGIKIPSAYMSLAVCRILGYRILDIVQWLSMEDPMTASQEELVQTGRGERRFLERLKLPKMKDWAKVIDDAVKGVSLVTVDEVPAPSVQPSSHEQYLFNSVVEMQSQTKGLKVISNFAMAALHLGILVKGNWDLAGSEIEPQVKQNQLKLGGSIESRLSCLRMPLTLAASLSPIALLQDKFLWKNTSDKKTIIDLLLVFGKMKPAVILEIERRLWLALVDLAKGERQTVARVTCALKEIEEIKRSTELADVCDWFSDDFKGFQKLAVEGQTRVESNRAPSVASRDLTSLQIGVRIPAIEEEEEESDNDGELMCGVRNYKETRLIVSEEREGGSLLAASASGIDTTLIGMAALQLGNTRDGEYSNSGSGEGNSDEVDESTEKEGDPGAVSHWTPRMETAPPASPTPSERISPALSPMDEDPPAGGAALEQSRSPDTPPSPRESGSETWVSSVKQNDTVEPASITKAGNPAIDRTSPERGEFDQIRVTFGERMDSASDREEGQDRPRGGQEVNRGGSDAELGRGKRVRKQATKEATLKEPDGEKKGRGAAKKPKGGNKRGARVRAVKAAAERAAKVREAAKKPRVARKKRAQAKAAKGATEKGKKGREGAKKEKAIREREERESEANKTAERAERAAERAEKKGRWSDREQVTTAGGRDQEKREAHPGRAKIHEMERGREGEGEQNTIDLSDATPRYIGKVKVVGKRPLRAEVPEEAELFAHPRLTVPTHFPQKTTGPRTVSLRLPSGKTMDYTPCFHHEAELDVFYELFDMAWTGGNPPWLGCYSAFKALRPDQAQDLLRVHRAMIVEGVPFQPRKFDWEGLRGIFGDTSDVLCIDYKMETRRDVIGSVGDLMDAMGGNIIGTKRVNILASSHRPPASLASDKVAWLYTIDQPFCKRKHNIPQSQTQWEAASTKGAFERWTVPQHGYCTFLNVVVGTQWVLLARPKAFDGSHLLYLPDRIASFEPYGVNRQLWDVDAVVVPAGSQLILSPLTPYRILSIDNTISGGGSFYSMGSLAESCIGYMQSFVNGSVFTDKDESESARLLLARMLMYVHERLVVHGELDSEHKSTLHLPDCATVQGLLGILSLINIAELANVLHPETYREGVPPTERMFLIHVRSLGRALRRALGSRFKLQVPGRDSCLTVKKWADRHLSRQASALFNYKQLADSTSISCRPSGFTLDSLMMELSKCLGHNNWVAGSLPSFAWPEVNYEVVRGEFEADEPEWEEGGETLDDRKWMEQGRHTAV